MPINAELSSQDRLVLIQALNALPDPMFKQLVFALNPPAEILPSDLAAQGDRAFTLLQWVEGAGRGLGELQSLYDQLVKKPLVEKQAKLAAADWTALFEYLSPYDFAGLYKAFLQAFDDAYRQTFRQMRPDHPPLQEIGQVQKLLAMYDDPLLAVRFVERVDSALQASDEPSRSDLVALEKWRDRIAQKFNIFNRPDPPETKTVRYAYLLITLVPLTDSQVMAYPELRLTGQEKPVPFGAEPVKETVDNLADSITQWIDLAEIALVSDDNIDCEVTLELFLPCRYLLSDYDVASQWQVPDPMGGERISLVNHRRLVVRSGDRAIIRKQPLRRQIQQRLIQNWQRLKEAVQNGSACIDFHRQLNSPSAPGDLRVLLNDRPGLKFLAPWPAENDKQTSLINAMISPAVPIVLWSSESAEGNADTLEAEFDALLRGCQLTNFVALAELWRKRRIELPAARHIRLLCDCPDRLPRLPDSSDDDALVSPA